MGIHTSTAATHTHCIRFRTRGRPCRRFILSAQLMQRTQHGFNEGKLTLYLPPLWYPLRATFILLIWFFIHPRPPRLYTLQLDASVCLGPTCNLLSGIRPMGLRSSVAGRSTHRSRRMFVVRYHLPNTGWRRFEQMYTRYVVTAGEPVKQTVRRTTRLCEPVNGGRCD